MRSCEDGELQECHGQVRWPAGDGQPDVTALDGREFVELDVVGGGVVRFIGHNPESPVVRGDFQFVHGKALP
jgi:hypothetical protein